MHQGSGNEGTNPWRELRRRAHLRLRWWWFDGRPSALWSGDDIYLDPRLDQTERRCALMHELVHEERGIGFPDATAATMQREEETVRRETAVRLVPLDDLAAFVRARSEIDPVTARCVADEYEVTIAVALEAMRALARREGIAA